MVVLHPESGSSRAIREIRDEYGGGGNTGKMILYII